MQVSKKPGAAALFDLCVNDALIGAETGMERENISGMRAVPSARTTNMTVRVFIKTDKVVFRNVEVKVPRVL
jgi:hypothetical protein